MSHPHQIRAGIVAGPHQITHRLHLSVRHGYDGEVTQAQQPGQMRSITGVGLDPIPGRTDQLRRCCHHTLVWASANARANPNPVGPAS